MQIKPKVLIIDDELSILQSLKLLLSDIYEVTGVESGEKGIASFKENTPDIVLLDIILPAIDGIQTLKAIKESNPKIPVVMLSGENTVRSAVESIKCGAVEYINKPFEIESLKILLKELIATANLKHADVTFIEESNFEKKQKEQENERLSKERKEFEFIGTSPSILSIKDKINQISKSDTTVLITGESGTGKEIIAKMIHHSSKRAGNAFVALNCGAIPESLIESELFGHEKGSFTHAVEKRIGHFELANGGTLFLDEIGELSLNVQVKLLRFLQEQEFYRIGKSKAINVDVRIITATNKKLEDLILQKKFREDLFYRINVIKFGLPPLRERQEDIPALINYFCEKFSKNYHNRVLKFNNEAVEALKLYMWKGNIRELENFIESLYALSLTDEITIKDIPTAYLEKFQDIEESSLNHKTPLTHKTSSLSEVEVLTREKIERALILTNYNQSKTANLLGVTRRILKYKMDKLGLKCP